MAAPSSSSSSSFPIPRKTKQYDVSLSFRFDETIKDFVDHLSDALKRQGISYVYFKYTMLRSKTHLKSFLDSKIRIIVFSQNYAYSPECLDELVMLMRHHNTICPVYYDVEPLQVLEAFDKNKNEALGKDKNESQFENWREALEEATNLVGWEFRSNAKDGHEDGFLKMLVKEISHKLHAIHLKNDDNFIGMESRLQDIVLSLEIGLDDVHMIGIQGMQGSGKTTLARAVFDKLCIQFEHISFVENVKEVSEVYGTEFLQEKVLSDVLHEKGITVTSVHDGKDMMKMRLHSKRVFVVLDDVDHISQLEALAGAPNWFEQGSLIIITTRDEQLLMACKVNQVHDVTLLNENEASFLFSRYAFGTSTPPKQYTELTKQVVDYAAGLPLAIIILGSFLFKKEEFEWVDELERLKAIPSKDTLNILEFSYSALEDDHKEIFLDVACFLKGYLVDDAIRILEGLYGDQAGNGLRVLEQYHLITVLNQRLGIHDVIQEMGRSIVRRLHPNEPNKHSRLWIPEEIESILFNDMGTEATRAIMMDSPLKLSSETVTNGFGSMKNLRMLHMVSEIDEDCDVNIDEVQQSFPNMLQFLSWVGYPHWSLPETFEANNLVRLDMSYSRILQLWEGGERKVLNKLRYLDLSFSMVRTIDLGQTPNLERLDLEDCYQLKEVCTPIGCLKRLVYLNLSGCKRIRSFLFIRWLESVEILFLNRLFLKEFPDLLPGNRNNTLQEVRFRYNDIEALPSSIGNLQKLVYLDLHSCIKLSSLPESICGLRNLRNLKLNGCILGELPEEIGHLDCLEKLNLSFTRIKHLPDSICMLKHLKALNLSSCWNLEKLPRDIGRLECLRTLNLKECAKVKEIPDSICKLGRMEVLNIEGTRIKHLPQRLSLLKGLKVYEPKSGLRSRG